MINLEQYESFSFPLHGCLTDELDGIINTHKEFMCEILQKVLSLNKKVFILTKSFKIDDYYSLTAKKKNERLDETKTIEKILDKLNLDKNLIIYTNGNSYYHYINNSNTHLHFDSSKYELLLFKEHSSINCFDINNL